MLRDWVGDLGLASFMGEFFQKKPLAVPDTARDARSLFSWTSIGELLDGGERPDMLVVRNGHLVEGAPKSAEEANAAFAGGYSIVMRRLERNLPQIAELARAMEEVVDGDASIQAYATPGRYFSFGWHYDCEDVFIVQTEGVKDYQLRRNTVNPRPTIDAMPRDMQFAKETSPQVIACTLVAGDWLYIPWGWWHVARGIEDSLSLSIGVLSPAARGKGTRRRVWHSMG